MRQTGSSGGVMVMTKMLLLIICVFRFHFMSSYSSVSHA